MAPLLSELAQVATEEKSLLEEGFELLGLISSLQVEISFYLSIGLNFSEDQPYIIVANANLVFICPCLQLQEESLNCHLIQLNSRRSTEHLPARNATATA